MTSFKTYQTSAGTFYHFGKKLSADINTEMRHQFDILYNKLINTTQYNDSITNYEVSMITINGPHTETSGPCDNSENDETDHCPAVDTYIVKFFYYGMEIIGFLYADANCSTRIVGDSIDNVMLIDGKLYSTQGEILSCVKSNNNIQFKFVKSGGGDTNASNVYLKMITLDNKKLGNTTMKDSCDLGQIANGQVFLKRNDGKTDNTENKPYLFKYNPTVSYDPVPITKMTDIVSSDSNYTVDATIYSATYTLGSEIYFPCFNMKLNNDNNSFILVKYGAETIRQEDDTN